MADADTLTIGGWLGISRGGRLTLERGVLTTAGPRITACTPLRDGETMPSVDLGGDDAVVLPGFIDTHLHLPQWDSIGAEGLTLLDWLDRVIFPAEARWADADFAGQMATRAARELLSFGTTGLAAYGTVHHEGTRAAMHVIEAAHLRAAVGQVLMDRGAPDELCRPATQLLREAEALTDEAWSSRIEHAITPRFALSCTEQLLHGAGTIARRTGAVVQTHISENLDECEQARMLFGGNSYAGIYRDAGLLGPRTLLGHGVWLDDAERRMIADSQSIIAHCPTANLFLSSGMLDLAAARAAGVRCSLGSDVAAGSDRSMPRVARWMIETARARALMSGDADGAPPTAAEAWYMITAGNADALGWPDTGRLAEGCSADVVVATPTRDWARGTERAEAALLYGWDERWIDTVLVAGRPVADHPAGV